MEMVEYRETVENAGFAFYSVRSNDDVESLFKQISANPKDVWVRYYGPGGQIPAPEQNPETGV